ncbi:MAG: hypothetical protein J6V44_12700 [Methanobrevibacter sp.]|nr:hypothetical protein [Methanobrevibacter sp.]
MTIETKHNIGNKAFWVGYDGNWHEGEVFGVFVYNGGIKYAIKEQEIENKIFLIYVDEQDLFSTKEELLKSL